MTYTPRCFDENPSVTGFGSPIYNTFDPMNMDIADLFQEHYGQNPKYYSKERFVDALKRFSTFYEIEELSSDIDFIAMEKDYMEELDGVDYEFETIEEFVEYWNKFKK